MNIHILGFSHLASVVSDALRIHGHSIGALSPTTECVLVAYDTPLHAETADTRFVLDQFTLHAPEIPSRALVVVMSQLPVGTVRSLELLYPSLHFASCPENIRANSTYHDFLDQRLFCGVRDEQSRSILSRLFHYTTPIFMSVESAEMVKHTINAYLALCISFMNEIGDVCKAAGADVEDVECGLRSDSRVSPLAPLTAGDPFGLGHLDRDLNYLLSTHETDLIRAIQFSNENRRFKVGKVKV